MKESLLKICEAIVKIVVIYILLISAIATTAIGVRFPELGLGILVISVFILIISDTVKGGVDHDSGTNET